MTTTKQYDHLNRLKAIASVAGTETVASFTYTCIDANLTAPTTFRRHLPYYRYRTRTR